MLSTVLHSIVVLKRTWDMKLALLKSSGLSVPNLAISGFMLMTFMAIYLFQLRFDDTCQFGPYSIKPPMFLIYFQGILTLVLFWCKDLDVAWVDVRDVYALEFLIFKNPS